MARTNTGEMMKYDLASLQLRIDKTSVKSFSKESGVIYFNDGSSFYVQPGSVMFVEFFGETEVVDVIKPSVQEDADNFNHYITKRLQECSLSR